MQLENNLFFMINIVCELYKNLIVYCEINVQNISLYT